MYDTSLHPFAFEALAPRLNNATTVHMVHMPSHIRSSRAGSIHKLDILSMSTWMCRVVPVFRFPIGPATNETDVLAAADSIAPL